MKRVFLLALFVASLSTLAAIPSSAQSRSLIGPKVGVWLDMAKFGIGAIGDFAITNEWSFEPGVQFVVGLSRTTLIVLDGNVRYNFALRGETFSPYVNGGLGLWIASYDYEFNNGTSSATDLHLNFGGGITFSTRSNIQPFAGLNVAFISGSDVQLYGGVKFAI